LCRDVMIHGDRVWNQLDDVAVVAVWGIAGLIVALRRFRWEPRER
jgi:hypothetical protein